MTVPDPPNVQTGYATTHDGHRLFCRRIGDGAQATIVPMDALTFDGLRALARPDRSLIFYDPRNRGNSDSLEDLSAISVGNDLRDIDAIRRHHRLQRFSLVGYSVYGLEVALYGMEYPEQLHRIVQLGPVPLKFGTEYPREYDNTSDESASDPELWEELQRLRQAHFDQTNPQEYSRKAWEFMGAGLAATPEGLNRVRSTLARVCELRNEWPINFRKHLEAHLASITKLSTEWGQLANRITFPVLVIHGRKDRNAPYGGGREWASRLPDARLVTVEHGAHQSWDDDPELVVFAIDEFLDGRWPSSAQRVDTNLPPRP